MNWTCCSSLELVVGPVPLLHHLLQILHAVLNLHKYNMLNHQMDFQYFAFWWKWTDTGATFFTLDYDFTLKSISSGSCEPEEMLLIGQQSEIFLQKQALASHN